ncbi:hypothetical protein [Methylobacter sp. S3L5C]|uniref:hypothetical protein n=1 Tax=Methylobacter sp. S3L5C TaxID=2839024 RepID=UPI001FAB4BF7|nr:hypothetical protein [Methylobacter sp. S3L5C]UOA07362.1 hypothetical protein KKZ03_13870 [Methylobacter sp. S3L5C]
MENKPEWSTRWFWFALGLLAFVSGLAGGALAVNQLMKVPLQRLSLSTPAFVLDRSRLIRDLSPNATPEQMTRAVEDWQRLANRLSDAGYLILDSTAVLAAPDDIYVRPEGH